VKSTKITARLATVLLGLFALAATSLAATHPLNDPTALAVDANGNLWVANQGNNSILEYSPKYAFQSKATITQGIDTPTGIAFDPSGNLWVVNSAANNVTEYTSGVQNTAATITGFGGPTSIAIDGLANIWVLDQFNSINVYVKAFPYTAQSTLLTTVTPATPVYGLAIAGGSLAQGTLNQAVLTAIEQELTNSPVNLAINNKTSLTMAGTANGTVYMGAVDGTVNVFNPAKNTTGQFLKLGIVPPGMTVDSVRGRVYLSTGAGNTILVYNTKGKLLHTIQ
jgi:sugar lactone lactonase YvrE